MLSLENVKAVASGKALVEYFKMIAADKKVTPAQRKKAAEAVKFFESKRLT